MPSVPPTCRVGHDHQQGDRNGTCGFSHRIAASRFQLFLWFAPSKTADCSFGEGDTVESAGGVWPFASLLRGNGRAITPVLRLALPATTGFSAGTVAGAGLCAQTPVAVRRIVIAARSFTLISLLLMTSRQPGARHPESWQADSRNPNCPLIQLSDDKSLLHRSASSLRNP